jgi:transposase-like protein
LRIHWQPREKASIVMLRKNHGYTINALAKAFGRSPSLIHAVLKFNSQIGNLPLKDLRRIPSKIKKIGAARMTRQLDFFMGLWEQFILGEESEPP